MQKKRPKRELDALVEAACAYADATERGEGAPLEGARKASLLRLAAKRFRAAEIQENSRNPRDTIPDMDTRWY